MKTHAMQPDALGFLHEVEASLNRYGAEHPGMSPGLEQKCIAALDAILDQEPLFEPTRKTVTIIGGGISGLFAGWLLARSGFEVTIHERSSNLDGGRCNSFELVHEGKRHAVAPGAMRIPDDFSKHLIGRLRIPVKEFKNETSTSCIITADGRVLPYTYAAQVFNSELSERWENELREIEAHLDEGADWIDVVQERQLHKLTTKQYLLSRGWKEADAEQWLAQGFGLGGYKCWDTARGGNVAVFEIMRDELMCYPGEVPHHMVKLDDMLDLPRALFEQARRAGVHFHFNSTIRSCEPLDDQIQLINERNHTFVADSVIDTSPPAETTGIHLTRSRKIFLLVEHKNSDLAGFEGKSLMQIQVRKRFARYGIGELYIEQASPEHVIFVGYAWGSEAKACGDLSEEALARQMYGLMEETFSNLVALKQFHVKTWHQAFRMSSIFDQWYPFEGSYKSHFSKGKDLSSIYSAGDWCSPDTGFIRGALAKALHATLSIINREQPAPVQKERGALASLVEAG